MVIWREGRRVWRESLRGWGWRLVPAIMAERARDHERDLRRREGVVDLAERFVAEHGRLVLGGPIAGLELAAERLAEIDAPIAKLLGTYEEEIQPALQDALDAQPRRFVDLGSADGYFAAGVARTAGIHVDAFDIAASARDLTRHTAALNGVAHLVSLHRKATRVALTRLDLERALVLCDVEGAERDLFDAEVVRALETANVIIELHTKGHSDVEDVIAGRFSETHAVKVVEATPRNPDLHDALQVFHAPEERDHAINELLYRTDGLRWAVMAPYVPKP